MDDPSPETPGAPTDRDETPFDDPVLESKFGLAGLGDWISRAREAERPGGPLGRLGPYELLEEIGRGGQGVVYKAVQPGTGRTIAIKRLLAGYVHGTRAHARFAQEVRALCRLTHPSIVTVYGAEVIDGAPVLLMEFVAGMSIDLWADGRPGRRRPISQILSAFVQVCDAVAYAHQRGVIHCDLKPSNILVNEAGLPRVLDFGIARLFGDASPAELHTVTGFAGTPSYTPPEQLESGGRPDTRTDVYALGAILHRLLTGADPFPRELPLAQLVDSVRAGRVPRPSAVRPDLPREFDWVVLRAMNVDPQRRYHTVDALAADVRSFVAGWPVAAHPPSLLYTAGKFIRRRRLASAATAAALLLIIGLGAIAAAKSVDLSRQNIALADALARESRAREEADHQRARADERAAAHAEAARGIADVVRRIGDRAAAQLSRESALRIVADEMARLPEPDPGDGRVQFRALRARLAHANRRYDEAIEHWRIAIREAEALYGPQDRRLAPLHWELATVFGELNRHHDALPHARLALELGDPGQRPRARDRLARTLMSLGSFGEAEAVAAAFLDEVGADPRFRVPPLELLCDLDLARGRLEAARAHAERALAELALTDRPDDFGRHRIGVTLAGILVRLGRPAEAEPLAAAAVHYRLRINGSLAARTAEALRAHADALSALGRFSEAADRLALLSYRIDRNFPADSRELARHRFKLAAAQLGAGAADEGRRSLALALTLGASAEADAPQIAEDLRRLEVALENCGWRVTPELTPAMGPLAWLVASPPDPPGGQDNGAGNP